MCPPGRECDDLESHDRKSHQPQFQWPDHRTHLPVTVRAPESRLGRVNPFEAAGVWLKCAFHAHTANSDGELAPDLLVRHYDWAGYDVLAITDHWVRTVEPSTERLLVIPSTELNATAGGPEHDAHVLALGLGVDPELPDVEVGFGTLGEVVAWVNEQGAVPYLAHTYWSGLRTDQFE